MRRAAALLAAAVLAGSLPAQAAAPELEFLHVEANVGASTGGHFAVRLGERVFHYQSRDGGTLRLVREDFDFFRYVYGVLQNRTIHARRVAVDRDTWTRLRDRFASRLLIEQAHFAALRALRDDVAWLEHGLPGSRVQAPPVAGAGFFRAPGGAEPALVALRRRIERERSARFLDARARRIDTALAALAPSEPTAAPDPPSRDRLPLAPYTFSQRAADLGAQRLALDVLRRAPALRAGWLRSTPDDEAALTDVERAALAAFAARLEGQLAGLVASRRPDWGAPLLVGMARLVALDASLRGGRLVVLDAFPADARTLPAAQADERVPFLAELRDDARDTLRATRVRVLAGDAIGERDWSDLEDAANRYLELERGLREGRDVRVSSERLVPHGSGTLPRRLRPRLSQAARRAALPAARARALAAERSLARLYRYDLVRRNCATEVFESVRAELSQDESRARLGGSVDPHGALVFVPFAALRAVDRAYRVVERTELPSYRRRRLAEMYARENPLRVYLREANTLTSSVYRPSPTDPFFLVFTDDAGPLRPLFGAFNLAAGLGEAFVGVWTLPLDGGTGVVAGAKGALFSLPELAFVSLRKGSLEYGRGAVGAR